jgi:hypothetical protein
MRCRLTARETVETRTWKARGRKDGMALGEEEKARMHTYMTCTYATISWPSRLDAWIAYIQHGRT